MQAVPAVTLALCVSVALHASQRAHGNEIVTYRGMCDASAAVSIEPDHFVVADDERNKLRIYQRGKPNPVREVELSSFLDTADDKESDLEGAAAIGARIYWISSHGRNSKGEVQKRRFRFFATEVSTGPMPALAPVGKPYRNLLADLLAARELGKFKLSEAARLAPEAEGGLNIEGLAATPNGELLIGFRNPIPGGRALLVPLKNPKRVVEGEKALFGPPIQLNLGGRGIRSMELVGTSYLVVAGPPADQGDFALYRWSGDPAESPTTVPGIDFGNLRPEALFAIPRTHSVQILSDDGGVKTGGVECKKLEQSRQSFRSITVNP